MGVARTHTLEHSLCTLGIYSLWKWSISLFYVYCVCVWACPGRQANTQDKQTNHDRISCSFQRKMTIWQIFRCNWPNEIAHEKKNPPSPMLTNRPLHTCPFRMWLLSENGVWGPILRAKLAISMEYMTVHRTSGGYKPYKYQTQTLYNIKSVHQKQWKIPPIYLKTCTFCVCMLLLLSLWDR